MRKQIFRILSALSLLGLVLVGRVDAQTLATPGATVDYYLPYPGILPDHPLYWLKMIRDRVGLWLTTDSLMKAEKLLLYADKRLGAGWALVEGNKQILGVSTLTKAEKYLEQAVVQAQKLGEGGEAERFKDKLTKAVGKHEEVLLRLKEKVSEPQRGVIEQMLEVVKRQKQLVEQTEEAVETVTVTVEFSQEETVSGEVEARTALAALQELAQAQGWQLEVKEYDFGSLVESVNEVKNIQEKAWIYFVNGEAGQVAADKHELKPADVVEWKYI